MKHLGAWVDTFARLEVELRDPDERGFCQCYYRGMPIGVCTEDDPEAIREVVAYGIPEEVVILVSRFYNEAERW